VKEHDLTRTRHAASATKFVPMTLSRWRHATPSTDRWHACTLAPSMWLGACRVRRDAAFGSGASGVFDADAWLFASELVGQGGCREDGLGAREGPRGGGDECWWRRSPSTTMRS